VLASFFSHFCLQGLFQISFLVPEAWRINILVQNFICLTFWLLSLREKIIARLWWRRGKVHKRSHFSNKTCFFLVLMSSICQWEFRLGPFFFLLSCQEKQINIKSCFWIEVEFLFFNLLNGGLITKKKGFSEVFKVFYGCFWHKTSVKMDFFLSLEGGCLNFSHLWSLESRATPAI
jgi:hypothetical protein